MKEVDFTRYWTNRQNMLNQLLGEIGKAEEANNRSEAVYNEINAEELAKQQAMQRVQLLQDAEQTIHILEQVKDKIVETINKGKYNFTAQFPAMPAYGKLTHRSLEDISNHLTSKGFRCSINRVVGSGDRHIDNLYWIELSWANPLEMEVHT